MALAYGLAAPELNLEDDDAETVGKALAKVLEFNDIKVTPKQKAYAELAKAMIAVYPPMIVQIAMRKNAERQAKGKARPTATITPIRHSAAPLDPKTPPAGNTGFEQPTLDH